MGMQGMHAMRRCVRSEAAESAEAEAARSFTTSRLSSLSRQPERKDSLAFPKAAQGGRDVFAISSSRSIS